MGCEYPSNGCLSTCGRGWSGVCSGHASGRCALIARMPLPAQRPGSAAGQKRRGARVIAVRWQRRGLPGQLQPVVGRASARVHASRRSACPGPRRAFTNLPGRAAVGCLPARSSVIASYLRNEGAPVKGRARPRRTFVRGANLHVRPCRPSPRGLDASFVDRRPTDD